MLLTIRMRNLLLLYCCCACLQCSCAGKSLFNFGNPNLAQQPETTPVTTTTSTTKPTTTKPTIPTPTMAMPTTASILSVGTTPPTTTTTTTTATATTNRDITIGPCTWAINRKCPDDDVKFYLYTRQNINDRQHLQVDETLETSNITSSYFNRLHPTKIIIHGYNSDMFLNPLQMMKKEYLAKSEYNIIYVDWSILSPGPCYVSAVHNTKHAGACVAQLVERILDLGSSDMHVIGFSLGAQLTNYIARNLGSFMLPRITGLDPAMPLFITAPDSDKLDASDAVYVDVIHTNALVQGKLERCGHADFYMNGGISQPGCYAMGTNPFACSHQRAPAYFLESIRSPKGFWGWACSSYISYLLGMCPPTNYLMEAGENIRMTTRGMFLINTNSTPPFALGKWTDLPSLSLKRPQLTLTPPLQGGDPLLKQVDTWGKLSSNFNNLDYMPATPYSQDPYGDNWTYFSAAGTADITNTEKTTETGNDDSVEELDTFIEYTPLGKPEPEDITAYTTLDPPVNWHEYKRNLTEGFIENSIFQVPRINYK